MSMCSVTGKHGILNFVYKFAARGALSNLYIVIIIYWGTISVKNDINFAYEFSSTCFPPIAMSLLFCDLHKNFAVFVLL